MTYHLYPISASERCEICMGRKPRIWYPGATYHITSRGNRRSAIFYDDADRLKYLALLSEVHQEFPFKIHAYCLMTNHIHLLMETTDYHSKKIMKRLHSLYAIYFNKRHDLSGHVFSGRYHARLIRNTNYFLEVSKYIHLNPYMANIVDSPEKYYWSSYKNYLAKTNHSFLTTTKVLQFFSEDSVVLYKEFVEKDLDNHVNRDFLTEFYDDYLKEAAKKSLATISEENTNLIVAESFYTENDKKETPLLE